MSSFALRHSSVSRASWLVTGLGIGVLSIGCASRADSGSQVEPGFEASSSTQTQGDAEPARNDEEGKAPDADISLYPAGIGGVIRSSVEAKVVAHDTWLDLDGGPNYRMEIHRGDLDPLVEKANIVREYGDEFRQFIEDTPRGVIYETSRLNATRYHFFARGTVQGLTYHCKSGEGGVPERDDISRMIEDCHSVKVRPSLESQLPDEPKKTEPPAGS